jgi:proteasome alpha subunit
VTTPFGYVSPEQLMKDKADYARKGISRGRSVVVVQYANGILLVAENPSRSLHKINELYDRIGFAAVGRYNEFENLRMAGVRLADLRGYAYDRRDVTGRGLANTYAQTLGAIFIESAKPYEVEIIVAEVADTPAGDEVYRLTYDGSVADEHGFAVMGGQAEQITRYVESRYRDGLTLAEALRLAVDGLANDTGGPPRSIPAAQLEVAVLDRDRPRRKFRRLSRAALEQLLSSAATTEPRPTAGPEGPEHA